MILEGIYELIIPSLMSLFIILSYNKEYNNYMNNLFFLFKFKLNKL